MDKFNKVMRAIGDNKEDLEKVGISAKLYGNLMRLDEDFERAFRNVEFKGVKISELGLDVMLDRDKNLIYIIPNQYTDQLNTYSFKQLNVSWQETLIEKYEFIIDENTQTGESKKGIIYITIAPFQHPCYTLNLNALEYFSKTGRNHAYFTMQRLINERNNITVDTVDELGIVRTHKKEGNH